MAKQSTRKSTRTKSPRKPSEPNELTTTDQPNPTDKSKAAKYTSPQDLFDLISVKGLTYEEAGKILGITKQSAWEMARRHNIHSKSTIAKFKQQRADYLASKGMDLLASLTPDDIKDKMNPYQRIVGAGILYDKERLERGQATQHIAYADMSEHLGDIDKEINQIQGIEVSTGEEGIDEEIGQLEAELGVKEEEVKEIGGIE